MTELETLELELKEACYEYWMARKQVWEDPSQYVSGTMSSAKMRMYRAMKNLWGNIDDLYGDYSESN